MNLLTYTYALNLESGSSQEVSRSIERHHLRTASLLMQTEDTLFPGARINSSEWEGAVNATAAAVVNGLHSLAKVKRSSRSNEGLKAVDFELIKNLSCTGAIERKALKMQPAPSLREKSFPGLAEASCLLGAGR